MIKFKISNLVLTSLFLILTLSSCEAIAGIFKAGFWVGIIIVVVIVAIILWLVGKAKK